MSIKEDIEKVQKKVNEIEEQSLAMQMISDYKRSNKRLFIIWIVTFIAFIGLLGYTIYLLNDIGTIETTEEVSQNNDNGYNSYIGNNGDINNGNTKDKENN